MGNLLACHRSAGSPPSIGDDKERAGRTFSLTARKAKRSSGSSAARNGTSKKSADAAANGNGNNGNDDSYDSKTRIDDEVLVLRYLHLMQNDDGEDRSRSGRRRQESGGSVCRVSFRAESFDSQSSTTSERRQFVIGLVDNLPETFVDDDLPPASVRGRLVSWSSCSSAASIGGVSDNNCDPPDSSRTAEGAEMSSPIANPNSVFVFETDSTAGAEAEATARVAAACLPPKREIAA